MARVLVVDDEPAVARIFRRHLELEGFTVVTARSGEEALQILDNDFNFDLLITDLRMGGMDGIELGRKVHFTYPAIPLVLATSRLPDGDLPDYFVMVIMKPPSRVVFQELHKFIK